MRLSARVGGLTRRRFCSAAIASTVVAKVAALSAAKGAENSPEALTAAVDRYVIAQMEKQRLPGIAIGIFRHGRSILSKGYGFADLERRVPVTPNSVMETGSIGKQFTATAIMMLVEGGQLALTDAITKFFPELPASWSSMTIANLLSHTSGIGDYFSLLSFGPGGRLDLYRDYAEAEILAEIAKLPAEFPPGERWEYRNTNYLLLGYLIERISGETRNAFLKRHVFDPLGMASARGLSEREVIADRALGYVIVGGTLQHQNYVSDTFASTGDGGLLLSVNDYERWERGLRDCTIISPASLGRMWTPFRLSSGQLNQGGYGFGWFISMVNGRRVIEHGGEISGFNTMFSRYPDVGLAVVAQANLDRTHSSILGTAHVISGLVEPALMPKPAMPIADDNPRLGRQLLDVLDRLAGGQDVSDAFLKDAGYRFDVGDARDLRYLLPRSWHSVPFVLLKRQRSGAIVRSTYRIGAIGDTRQLYTGSDEAGKLWDYVVSPDPDDH